MNDLTEARKQFSLTPTTFEEAMKFCTTLSKSALVPKDFVGEPANILVAVQWGMELGLQPMQAMQSIAVINGRPSLWGDAVIGLVRASGLCEYVYEDVAADGLSATCRTKRTTDREEVIRTFTKDDAVKAGLWGKSGPWTQYPKRMLQMRARSWCLRDVYPDVLRGVHVAEESQDIPEKDVTPPAAGPVTMPKAKAEAKPAPVDAEPVKAEPEKKAEPEPAAQQEAAAQAQPVEAEAVPEKAKPANAAPASEGQLKMIRKRAEKATVTEQEICRKFEIDTIDGIDTDTGNLILAWLSNPAG